MPISIPPYNNAGKDSALVTDQIPELRDGFKAETVPTFPYDEAAAEQAWSEYVVLCDAEADLRRARMAAYNRLLAAFGEVA